MDNTARTTASQQTTWENFLFLISWDVFNDTIPSMLLLLALAVANAVVLQQYLFYVKKFTCYLVICYFCYFIHLATLGYEYKLFNGDLPFFYIVSYYLICCEMHIFLKCVEQLYKIKVPIVSTLLDKWQRMINNSTKIKEKK